MKVLAIVSAIEGYKKLKQKLINDEHTLTEIEVFDSAYGDMTREAKIQAEVVEADRVAIRNFLNLNLSQVPSILLEYKPVDTNNYSNKLNLEV